MKRILILLLYMGKSGRFFDLKVQSGRAERR
jgi:hypothetical protein